MAEPPVDVSFDQMFEEAVAYFRARVALTPDEYKALTSFAKHRAFAISGLAELSVVTDVWKSLDKALVEDVDVKGFKDRVMVDFLMNWKGKATAAPARLELVFQNAVQSSFNAGRWQQMQDEDIRAARPFWMYDGVSDSRQSSICREIDGIILPAGHPFFVNRWPPLHHACRTSVRTLTRAEALEKGVTEDIPPMQADDGFGAIPPLSDFIPRRGDYSPELWAAFEAKQGSGP